MPTTPPARTAAPVLLDTCHGLIEDAGGDLDDPAVTAFVTGQCIALAIETSVLTGGDIVAHLCRPGDLTWEDEVHGTHIDRDTPDGWFDGFIHALVRDPGGVLLDATGGHDEDDYREQQSMSLGTCALVTVDPDVLLAAVAAARAAGANTPVPDMPKARLFAPTVAAYAR